MNPLKDPPYTCPNPTVALPSLILDLKLLLPFYGNSSIYLKPPTPFLIFGWLTQYIILELKLYLLNLNYIPILNPTVLNPTFSGAKLFPYSQKSKPHRPKPNLLWSKTLSLFTKISTPPHKIDHLTFKSLYLTLLQPDPNPIPLLNNTIPHTWLRLTLIKPRPSFFTNLEKEISFRTAYKGYTWGCFFSKHNFKPRNPNDFLCKICLTSSDDPHHLFFHCPFTRSLITYLEPILSSTLKQHTYLTQDTLLFNYTNTIGTPHIITSKLASLIRLSLYTLKNHISSFNTPTPNSTLIDEKYKIKTKFKNFL